MESPRKVQRAELLIFTIITIANMLPFVATRFFPTMDGASHLSNSNIISQLVFHNNSLFHQFFQVNPEPVPNWTSHLLISLFTLVMPAFLAEKLLILILMLGIPFAFRKLMLTISPKHGLFSFMIFPFTHSMFFFFGFFNFCIAILFFLVALNFWLLNTNRIWNPGKIAVLSLLVALTYFSHIVIFGLLLIIIAIHILSDTGRTMSGQWSGKRSLFRKFLKKAASATLAAIVPLALFVYFFYSRPGTREINYIGKQELISYLVSIRPLISMNPIIEGKLTVILFYTMVTIICVGLLAFVWRLARKILPLKMTTTGQTERLLPGYQFWWLLISTGVLMLLYFKIPDAYGTASYTCLRIAFVFFLLAILWFSTFRIPWYFGLLAAIAGLYVNTMLIRYYRPGIRDLNKLAVACNKAAGFVAPNSLVLPINCMDNWFTGHFVDYIAIDKPIVMVYNYECQSGYFPVIWNDSLKPNYYMGNPATPAKYINFELVKGRPSLLLDYVFIVGQYDPSKDWFFGTLHKILTEDFTKVYTAENCSLYRNKLSTKR